MRKIIIPLVDNGLITIFLKKEGLLENLVNEVEFIVNISQIGVTTLNSDICPN